jgi:hypothetical protein
MDTNFRKKEATTDFTDNTDAWGAHAAWFESLAVASRPLQRWLAETIFFFTQGNEGLGRIESLFALPAQPARHGGRKPSKLSSV